MKMPSTFDYGLVLISGKNPPLIPGRNGWKWQQNAGRAVRHDLTMYPKPRFGPRRSSGRGCSRRRGVWGGEHTAIGRASAEHRHPIGMASAGVERITDRFLSATPPQCEIGLLTAARTARCGYGERLANAPSRRRRLPFLCLGRRDASRRRPGQRCG